MELTRSEIKIMKIFWNAKRPLTRRDIVELNTDPTWEMAALYSVINSLLSKGAIVESGISRNGRSLSREFEMKFALQDYITELLSPVDGFIDYPKLLHLLIKKTDDQSVGL